MSALANIGAAIGTVGALFVGLAVLRVEQKERARSEIRSVRCWLALDDPKWVTDRKEEDPAFDYRVWVRAQNANRATDDEPVTVETSEPVGIVENASDELIYDVRLRLAAPEVLGHHGEIGARINQLFPGKSHEAKFGMAVPARMLFVQRTSTGAEVVFTDGRGRRWHRDPNGRLTVRRPLRWWAPWRVPHRLELGDYDEFPWWAWAAHWAYRWEDASIRAVEGWPPPWWAVDVLWQRARWARKQRPVPRPSRDAWKNRDEWAARRAGHGIPPPWWAIDHRWRFWRWYRREMQEARKRDAAPPTSPEARS